MWPVPRSAHWQTQDFYRRFARAFEDIAHDIEDGQEPKPHNMAEEIALHLTIDFAANIFADMPEEFAAFTGGMPVSRFDFDFESLHDLLFQDKDYELAYLGTTASVARPGDLEDWFENFNYPEPRNRERGFRR
jgi:hypothetical protein